MTEKHSTVPEMSQALPILSSRIASEPDVVSARQRARLIAQTLGFDRLDQVRIATAVSEIARNALQYAADGRIEFALVSSEPQPALRIAVTDKGPGIPNLEHILNGSYQSRTGMGLGIVGARRLMDQFEMESEPGRGVAVRMLKYVPGASTPLPPQVAARLGSTLIEAQPVSSQDEFQLQTYQLVRAMDELRQREDDLRRITQELEDTNRGVMALYAELDDKAASLRRADELKSRFLSHVSHEFRTPLNSILALTRLLLARVDGALTPEQDKQIGYIRKAAEDLTEMVNDLLDLAKVEAGKTVVHLATFSVANLLGALRGMMRPMQVHAAVELTVEDPHTPLMLNSDEGKIGQILRNLVSNALKFTPQGEVRVKIARTAKEVTFIVSDTGIGIPAEQQERIFQEFAQVENPLQTGTKGTGLGLPLSRKLAELLGGTLSVQSELGRGSTFRFTLPASVVSGNDNGEQSAVDSGSKRSSAGSNTLLVIDDDEVARYLIRQFLRGSELIVEEADSGILGLDRARFDLPRLILLDLSMPDMSGFEVMDRLREDPETAAIPVIIYTSRTLTASDRERIARTASAVIPKRELTREVFIAELRAVLGDFAVNAGQNHEQ